MTNLHFEATSLLGRTVQPQCRTEIAYISVVARRVAYKTNPYVIDIEHGRDVEIYADRLTNSEVRATAGTAPHYVLRTKARDRRRRVIWMFERKGVADFVGGSFRIGSSGDEYDVGFGAPALSAFGRHAEAVDVVNV